MLWRTRPTTTTCRYSPDGNAREARNTDSLRQFIRRKLGIAEGVQHRNGVPVTFQLATRGTMTVPTQVQAFQFDANIDAKPCRYALVPKRPPMLAPSIFG